jgi:L-gulono-1,4-lactone dehydrogenase
LSPLWRNHAGNQQCRPQEIAHPSNLDELAELVRGAEARGLAVRASGARHSWSDAALTDGIMVEPDRLSGVERVDPATVRGDHASGHLVWVKAGTHLSTLNPALEAMGLALRNMGGYDAQTIAGVISTSTHGSGLAFPPFPDAVRSLELVISGGEMIRLEPQNGPSDPRTFEGGRMRLVQDDMRFAAAICAIGTVGLIFRVMIEVREKFWLREVRTADTWEKVRPTLTTEGVLGEPGHYELFVNPYANRDDGEHHLLVTVRSDCPEPHDEPPENLERHPLAELEASFKPVWFVLRLLARYVPSLIAKRFDALLEEMCDPDYTNVSYKVFNIGEANHLPAISMELGVAVDGRHLEAVERILAIAGEKAKEGIYHTSPFSLRFVAPSRAAASMMFGQPTMMIELILIAGTRGWEPLLAGYESALVDLGVRPHWGQINFLAPGRPAELYPLWGSWLETMRQHNSSGVFNSPFTDRLGIT